jgi:hypothetical protein
MIYNLKMEVIMTYTTIRSRANGPNNQIIRPGGDTLPTYNDYIEVFIPNQGVTQYPDGIWVLNTTQNSFVVIAKENILISLPHENSSKTPLWNKNSFYKFSHWEEYDPIEGSMVLSTQKEKYLAVSKGSNSFYSAVYEPLIKEFKTPKIPDDLMKKIKDFGK